MDCERAAAGPSETTAEYHSAAAPEVKRPPKLDLAQPLALGHHLGAARDMEDEPVLAEAEVQAKLLDRRNQGPESKAVAGPVALGIELVAGVPGGAIVHEG